MPVDAPLVLRAKDLSCRAQLPHVACRRVFGNDLSVSTAVKTIAGIDPESVL
jgi:hypothetical protein